MVQNYTIHTLLIHVALQYTLIKEYHLNLTMTRHCPTTSNWHHVQLNGISLLIIAFAKKKNNCINNKNTGFSVLTHQCPCVCMASGMNAKVVKRERD